MTIKRLAVCLACSVFSAVALAGDIYRWVDENGRVSISDNVPVRYRDVATKIDTSVANISERQRQQALERADRERQRAAASMDAAKTAPAQAAPVKAGELKPSQSGDESECDALIRAYRESEECFAPFKLREADGSLRQDGAVREEAYRYCTSIPAPFDKCVLPAQ